MEQVAFTNSKKKPVYVGGKQILPGETRTVGAIHLPAKPAVVFDAQAVLAGKVKDIAPTLEGFSDKQLGLLLEAEKAGANRSTMVNAITDVLVERDYADSLDFFRGNLGELGESELEVLLLSVADDPEKTALVNAALDALTLAKAAGNE